MAFTTSHGIKDLTAFASIESAMFVEWVIPTVGTQFISDYNQVVTIDSQVYDSLGELLTITAATSELRATGNNR